jgi:hypothetical protein
MNLVNAEEDRCLGHLGTLRNLDIREDDAYQLLVAFVVTQLEV